MSAIIHHSCTFTKGKKCQRPENQNKTEDRNAEPVIPKLFELRRVAQCVKKRKVGVKKCPVSRVRPCYRI